MNQRIGNIVEDNASWGYLKLCSVLNERFTSNKKSSIQIFATLIYASGVNCYGKMESIVILLPMIVDQNYQREQCKVLALPYTVSLVMVDDYKLYCYLLVKPNENDRKGDIGLDVFLSDMYIELKFGVQHKLIQLNTLKL